MATNLTGPDGKVLSNPAGDAVFSTGATVPTDAVAGYAVGCLFIHSDGAQGQVVYINEGTAASADFNVYSAEDALALTPDDSEGAGVNVIPANVSKVRLGANVNDANDFTVLPALADVPDGYEITIIAGSAANSELRTPATSDEEINSEDGDGTKEALLTATNIYKVVKNDATIGWTLIGHTAIGAFETAIVPD